MHACDRRTDGQTDRITTPKTDKNVVQKLLLTIFHFSFYVFTYFYIYELHLRMPTFLLNKDDDDYFFSKQQSKRIS